MATNTSLEINKNSYVAFDATSLRDLIIDRLNKNNVFTDQNYVGSNINSIIEIISYSFSTLMFYLNKTSTESMFTESQIYENINRIVKLIGYNPLGNQTSSVSFSLKATGNIPQGNYIIPRYSYINLGESAYSFNRDTAFTKKNSILETVIEEESIYRLYQGRFIEYPSYTAAGSENEVVFLAADDTTIVDHFNIDVYVRDSVSNKWTQWERVNSLFDYTSRDQVFEIRFNENKRYEIKFGDNINGKMLKTGDIVSVFYLSSAGTNGEINSAAFEGTLISKYNSENYNEILKYTLTDYSNILSDYYYSSLSLNNNYPSTFFTFFDSVEDIRNKAPKFYKSQNRLVTEQDYNSFIISNYNSIISDVAVKNNKEYLEEYMQYFYNIGLSNPSLESRALYNQVNFASACTYNNVYIFALPRALGRTFLMPSQKQIITTALDKVKTLTSNIVISDPVYIAANIGLKTTNFMSLTDTLNAELVVELQRSNRKSVESIKTSIHSIITSHFNEISLKLGSTINIYQMYTDILNIDGVSKVYTKNTLTNTSIEGLSFVIWNPIYSNLDNQVINQNTTLPFFKAIYFNSINNLLNKISFTGISNTLQNITV